MTFEQPANLNRYILPPIPLTWGFRWKLYKVLLPVAVFSAALLVPVMLLREWETGHWSFWRTFSILLLPVFLLVLVEVQMRLQLFALQKSKRTLNLEENHFRLTPPNMMRMPWQQMVAWRFQNLADDNRYQIVTVEFNMAKNGGRLRRRSIVLEKISQSTQLISELKFRQQKDGLAFSIEEYEAPAIPTPDVLSGTSQRKPARPTALYLYLAGAFLVMNGLPMLLGGLGMHGDSSNPNIKPNPNGSFAVFIRRHFSNVTEFRHFLLVTGTILCASGTALMIWGSLLGKRQKAQPT